MKQNAVKATGAKSKRFQENLRGYLFVSPAMLLLALFGIFPVFFTLFVSLHKWRIKRTRFLGLENFQEIFGQFIYLFIFAAAIAAILFGIKLFRKKLRGGTGVRASVKAIGVVLFIAGIAGIVYILPTIFEFGDDDMLQSLRVTIWYSLGTVPIQLTFGLILAVLLDQKFKGKQAFRVIFLLPYIVPSVASATVFERIFALRPESFANQILALFNKPPLEWLVETQGIFELLFGWGTAETASIYLEYWQTWATGPSLALFSIMFFNYWVFVGYYALIYSNGLANIPRQLYEAAEVDGAKKRTVFFKIIIPLLSPTTFFLTMLGIIGTFKAFNHLYVLRNAAARGAVDTMSIYIFFTFFRKSRFGYAAALSLILFAFVLGLTLLQRRIMEKRVFYGE